MRFAAENNSSVEEDFAIELHEKESVAEVDGDVMAYRDIRGDDIGGQNKLFDIGEFLPCRDVTTFIDADENIFALVRGTELDAEATASHIEEHGHVPVFERVASDQPCFGTGCAGTGTRLQVINFIH